MENQEIINYSKNLTNPHFFGWGYIIYPVLSYDGVYVKAKIIVIENIEEWDDEDTGHETYINYDEFVVKEVETLDDITNIEVVNIITKKLLEKVEEFVRKAVFEANKIIDNLEVSVITDLALETIFKKTLKQYFDNVSIHHHGDYIEDFLKKYPFLKQLFEEQEEDDTAAIE